MQKIGKEQKNAGIKLYEKAMNKMLKTREWNVNEQLVNIMFTKNARKKFIKKIKMKEHNGMINNKAIKKFCVDNKNDDL